MAVFEYRGILSATGKQVRGVRDSDHIRSLRAILKREGVLLTSAYETASGQKTLKQRAEIRSFFGRVGSKDITILTQQLATLTNASIPLVECITALTEQTEKIELKGILSQIRDQLNEGSSFAKSLEPHKKLFSPLYINMVAAGEASGSLEQVLERLADYMESQGRLRSKVKAALAYPILMLVIGVLLITTMMIVVIPKVTSIFASMDRDLPWYTSLLIAVSKTLASSEAVGFVLALIAVVLIGSSKSSHVFSLTKPKSLWISASLSIGVLLVIGFCVDSIVSYGSGIVVGLLIGLGVVRLLAYVKTASGRLWKDSFILRLPIFGNLVRMIAIARFSRTLATLLKSGIPLLKSMDIVKNILDNAKLEKVVQETTNAIREGESIAAPLKRSEDFPPVLVHMIAVGEKSGQLEQMLENAARSYNHQVEIQIQTLTSLLEPFMIVVMGGAVGFLAFSILMPLIQMNEF
ncbi:type II secretion system F family protein [Pajaroellobacter abortibovis]|uniref:General secretion pathway protein F n=1 Tax=Pajaroellobacter abortibovis TaxID=1882918 RepID=A0A1L6MX61_9BACT|nr:type II secretion system F family protein [Pajaroellobacter abortibovis]APS00019.1 hypothetical protein BCY86_04455 [Pajaroellobacter abortibovis]